VPPKGRSTREPSPGWPSELPPRSEPPPDPPADAQPIRGHLTAGEAADLATRAGVERLLLTHTWEEVGLDRYRRAAQERFAGPVDVARPGLTIRW
jgi:ribonuclease BN (tRNA processing enzyme)